MRRWPVFLFMCVTALCADTFPATAGTYYEDFTSRQYCDETNTTAWWDTTDFGSIKLHPFAVSVRGSCDTPGHARGLAIQGNYAYVADYSNGLQVIDIGDPANPYIAGSLDTPGIACNLTVDGNYVYIADGNDGVRVVNISDPTEPRTAHRFDTFSYATSVAIAGDRAYVSDGALGLAVFDISVPESVFFMGRCNSVNYANHVVVEGNYAYVADDDAGLQVFDVSDPSSPQLVGGCATPGPALHVAVSDYRAYVACGDSGLQYVDISTPANPVPGLLHPSPGVTTWVSATGDMLYTCEYAQGIRVYHIGDMGGIGLAGEYDLHGTSHGIALAGDFACVTSVNHGFKVIDIADRTGPFYAGMSEARVFLHMDVDGHYAYCANADRIDVVNLLDIYESEFVGTYAVNLPSLAGDLDISGNYLYAAIYDSLLVLDIADPTNPSRAGICDIELSADAVAVGGDYAYVTGGIGLSVVNVSDPAGPWVAAVCSTGFATGGIDLAGNRAYAGSEHNGLNVFDISDPLDPQLVKSLDTLGWCVDVDVEGDYAYVADFDRGFYVVDISDSAEAVALWSPGPASYIGDIEVWGDYAFVAAGVGYGLYIVDISDPTSPLTVERYGTGLEVNSLALYGDHVLLGEEEQGLQTVEVFQRDYDLSRNAVYSLPVAPGESVSRVRLLDSRSPQCLWEICADSTGHWQHVYEDSGWTDLHYPGDNLRWRATLVYAGKRGNPGAGMLSIEYDDVAGVEAADAECEFGLSPCSPNPFAAETRIVFALPERADVFLTVHDVRGRRVAVLARGVTDAGRHCVTWEGMTSDGKPASPGVYFARIETGRFRATSKVVLLE